MRDRLIELIKQARNDWKISTMMPSKYTFDSWTADRLIANGVIVPPCKVGDTVYYLANECDKCEEREYYCHRDCKKPTGFTRVNNAVIKRFTIYGNQFDGMSDEENTSTYSHIFYFRNIGKTIFLTKEEAERALKERENNADR